MAANIALVKNLTLHGVFWGSYMAQDPRRLRKGLEELLAWLAEGKILVPVSHRSGYCYFQSTALTPGPSASQ